MVTRAGRQCGNTTMVVQWQLPDFFVDAGVDLRENQLYKETLYLAGETKSLGNIQAGFCAL
jgi:hypothetical protein